MQLLSRKSGYISRYWDTSRTEVLVTPLAPVFCHGHPKLLQKDLIKMLVSHGADLGPGILHFASLIAGSHIGSLLDFVLEHRGKVSAVHESGRSLLMNLCIAGPIDDPPLETSIRALLNHKVDVSRAGNYGYTALHFASIRVIRSAVEMLIEIGADADPRTTAGLTPMHFVYMACTLVGPNRLLVDDKLFISHSPTWDEINHHPVSHILDALKFEDQQQNRHFEFQEDVTLREKAEVMSLLDRRGASVDAEDAEGCTPLHWATLLVDLNTVRLLLK